MDRTAYAGSRIADAGFGDGRNMPLLRNLGFEVYGFEIDEAICRSTQARMSALGIEATLRAGSNAAIPFPDSFFQYVLACHAFYYVQEPGSFDDNLRELRRVIVPGGTFVLSLPMADGYLLRGAESLGGGHVRIKNDPYGLRIGTVLRVFATSAEVIETFEPWFEDIQIGFTDDDYWGLRQRMWIVACKRRNPPA
jgi:SAM-dependent methyltransferase